MDPIEKIIERLKNEHAENGTYFLLKIWYAKALKKRSDEKNMYHNIYGFLFGLHASGYIGKSECDSAIEYLIEVTTEI